MIITGKNKGEKEKMAHHSIIAAGKKERQILTEIYEKAKGLIKSSYVASNCIREIFYDK